MLLLRVDDVWVPSRWTRRILCFYCVMFFIFGSSFILNACGEEPDWILEASAPWKPRDSQAEWVFEDQLWIAGGWFSSFESPPRDVWSSPDGREWRLVESEAPWYHSDLPMNLTFDGQMWIMGGWFDGRLPTHSAGNQVWSSRDGKSWSQATPHAAWSARCAGTVVEFHDRMWLLGGTESYYFGNKDSLKNDIWSSANGSDWELECERAAWKPRAYHQTVTLGDRVYVMGGGNYVPEFFAYNDVWSSSDGRHWRLETESAPWYPRLWFSAVSYRDRIWILGGWSESEGNFGDVWHSKNGRDWESFNPKVCWKPRHEHSALIFQDKIFIAGGHANPLSNEIWSLSLPKDWGSK